MPLLSFDNINDLFDEKGERASILLYANSIPRVSTYLPIARALHRAGHVCVLVMPVNTDTAPNMSDLNVTNISASQISKIKNLDLFISAEVSVHIAPREALRMAIWHSLPDTGKMRNYAGTFGSQSWLVKELDYMFVAARQTEAAWNVESYYKFIANIFPEGMFRGQRQNICVIPGGYPKIDALAQAAANAGPADRIFFCPTQSNQPESTLEAHGAEMIEAMLDLLPQYKLVFRPYPSGDREKFRTLADRFASNPRFIYDTSITGEDHAVHAALSVTDASSASVTLSLATLRPSIFFRPDRTEEDRDFYPVGIFAHDMEEFRAALSRFGSEPDCLKDQIERGRHDFVYNPGTAIECLLDIIPDILNDKVREDWLVIPRKPKICRSEAEQRKHLEFLWSKTVNGKRAGALQTYEMVKTFFNLAPEHPRE